MLDMFHIGVKATRLNELHLNTIGNNIANVNTEGYSRQEIVQETAESIDNGSVIMGTGADLQILRRIRDEAMDEKYRNNNTELGYWDRASTKLEELEANIAGINTNLASALNEFWDSWEAVADNPSSSPERINLLETTKNLNHNFKQFAVMVDDKREEINTEIINSAEAINKLSQNLANLSTKISQAESQGKNPNELLDKFDLAIDELSEYGEVTVDKVDDQRVVYFGSDEIVSAGHARQVKALSNFNINDEFNSELVWADDFDPISGLNKGKLNGLINIRDNILTNYSNQIDILANEMVDTINNIHKQGYSLGDTPHQGIMFFDPNSKGAEGISLSNEILSNIDNIAVSAQGEEGDNRIALQIADLRYTKSIDNKQSFNEYLNSIVNRMANDVSNFKNYQQAYSDTATQINNFRESVKGVSVNEETANLVKFQQAYQASAKVLTEAIKTMELVLGLV